MKKYLIFTMKRFIPFFIISGAVFTSICLSVFSSVAVSDLYFEFEGVRELDAGIDGAYSIIIIMAVLLFIFTCVAPIIANSYRNSLRSADLYNQIGKGHKNVRLTHNAIMLLAVLASFTFAFIFGIIVLAIRNNVIYSLGEVREQLYESDSYRITVPFMYHFAYFIPIYFFLVIGAIVNYFISYFLVTRANNALNSVITLILGHGILFAGLMTPFWYATIISDGAVTFTYLPCLQTPSMASITALAVFLFGSLLKNGTFNSSIFYMNEVHPALDIIALVLGIIGVIGFFVIGGFCIYKFFKEEESSGELAGKPQGRDQLQSIIFHVGASIAGLWALCISAAFNDIAFSPILGLFSFIPTVIIYGALYYVFYSLERRNFRLTKKDLTLLLPIFITNVLLGIASVIVTTNAYTEL